MLAQRMDVKAGLSSPRSLCSSCTPAPLLLSPGFAPAPKLDTETEMRGSHHYHSEKLPLALYNKHSFQRHNHMQTSSLSNALLKWQEEWVHSNQVWPCTKHRATQTQLSCLGTCIPLTASTGCQARHSSHTFTMCHFAQQHGNKNLEAQKTENTFWP